MRSRARNDRTLLRSFPLLLIVSLSLGPISSLLSAQSETPPSGAPESLPLEVKPAAKPQEKIPPDVVRAGTILRLNLSKPVNVARLKSGSELDGELPHAVWVVDRAVIPEGSHVHFIVDKVDRTKVKKGGIAERLDAMRSLGFNRKFSYQVAVRSATLRLPTGLEMPVRVEFIDAGEVVQLRARGAELEAGGGTGRDLAKSAPGVGTVAGLGKKRKEIRHFLHPVVTVQVLEPVAMPGAAAEWSPESSRKEAVIAAGTSAAGTTAASIDAGQPPTIPGGARARLLLLTPLSAGTSHEGDAFEARLLEPIRADGRTLLPEGSLFHGRVSKVVKPRRLSRAGSLLLKFETLSPPGGATQTIAASLAATETSGKAPMDLDTEGGLHGKGPGAVDTLKALTIGLAVNEVADEAVELAVHAVAPYAGALLGLATLLSRQGNDVTLPQYSELEVVFNRPLTLPSAGVAPSTLPRTNP